jgi:hypothetical protein
VGSEFYMVDSASHISKIFERKLHDTEYIQTFPRVIIPETIQYTSYLYTTYIRYYKSSRDDLMYTGGHVWLYANVMPFPIRNVKTYGFWYLERSWSQSPNTLRDDYIPKVRSPKFFNLLVRYKSRSILGYQGRYTSAWGPTQSCCQPCMHLLV